MKTFYNTDYTASKYAFDTTRKSGAIVESLTERPIAGLNITDPREYCEDALRHLPSVHSQKYIDAVFSGAPRGDAQSQGFDWDEGIFTMAVSHSAGLIAAAEEALTNNTRAGSLSSGLHHARKQYGSGFCTFNGLTVAAKHAQELGAERILVLDYDAHGGGGTWSIINETLPNVYQIDVTVSPFDTYTPHGESRIDVTKAWDYNETITKSLAYAETLDPFDLIIYNAGMDPLNAGVTEEDIVKREIAVRNFIGETPAIFALAGGYTWGGTTMDDLVNWHRNTLQEWSK